MIDFGGGGVGALSGYMGKRIEYPIVTQGNEMLIIFI
jgi:hypothetical protein